MRPLTKETFVLRSIATHGDRYDYSLVEIHGQNTKVKIICDIHGEFWQRPADHMSRTGCPQCGLKAKSRNRRRWIPASFVHKAREIHGNRFRYDTSVFTGANGPVRYECPEHGWIDSTFSLHIYSKVGCSACSGKRKRTKEDFVSEAQSRHGIKYNYDMVQYINGHTHVSIVCPTHGVFSQTPLMHGRKGQGCPTCSAFGQSKLETQWLDQLRVPERLVRRDGYCFDGFDPDTNTVYEFYGDFWHGNPDTHSEGRNRVSGEKFSDLLRNTQMREEKIRSLGYNLVTIWENDFKNERTHRRDDASCSQGPSPRPQEDY
jgi:hypothetical protein